MDRERVRDKFRGALMGAAVGDARGAPLEDMPTVVTELLSRLDEHATPLQYTDDTHMTIGMAESFVACGRFDGAHMATTFARNYAAEPWRGYGAGPPQIFALLEQGVSWQHAAERLFDEAGSYGNGAAMRSAPAALFAFSDLAQAAHLARDAATITHTHELGMEGAALQACAVAYLLNQDPRVVVDSRRLLLDVSGYLKPRLFVERLGRIEALLPEAPQDAVTRLLGNGIAAEEAVPAALYSFFGHPRSFADAVRFAIGLGGDTDTIASMAGALSGAYLGASAIPARWREEVEGANRLQSLADSLLDLALSRPSDGQDEGANEDAF